MKPPQLALLSALALALAGCAGPGFEGPGGRPDAGPIAPSIPRVGPSGYEASLANWVALRQEGALSDAEFAQARAKLLDETIFSPRELDRRPVPLIKLVPHFQSPLPVERELEVVVDFIVASDGSVRNIRELTGEDSEYARAWVQAVRNARYIPGNKDGRPVATEMQLRARLVFHEGINAFLGQPMP
jgi:Gram-negative bacterial TonB protein C-terminal